MKLQTFAKICAGALLAGFLSLSLVGVVSGATGYGTGTQAGVTRLVCNGTTITKTGTCSTRGQIPGTTTNDSPTAGNVGEFISAFGTASSTGDGQNFDIASITITGGNWLVFSIVECHSSGTWTRASSGVGTVTGDSSVGLVNGDTEADYIATSMPTYVTLTVPGFNKMVATSTILYLKGYTNQTVGTPACYGRISAARSR